MAGLPRLQWLVIASTLLPFLLLSTICSGHTTHYIKPVSSTPCPAETCFTLSEYAHQLPNYLSSNTTLLLLPGDHLLSVNLAVENVSVFEILSSTEKHVTKILCQGLVGLSFRNISHMAVKGLMINSCGKGAVIYSYPTSYGVSVHSVLDTSISNCSFQDSVGTALGVFHSSLDLSGNNYFTSNCTRCGGYTYNCFCIGGGIFASMSTLMFTGNSTFRANSAKSGGGINVQNSTVNFSGNNTFGNNSAWFGGGIFAIYNAFMTFTGNSIFRANSAKSGGGIYVQNSTVDFIGNSTFGNNSAWNGGGICAMYNALVTFNGNSIFRNNSAAQGGGVHTYASTLNFSGNSTFGNNSSLFGGGIFVLPNSSIIFNGSSIFRNNSAEYGGGIYTVSTVINLSGNSIFRNNYAAVTGGGVFTFQYSTLNFIGNTSFVHNSAMAGGGMSALHSTMKFTGKCIFINNSANSQGGGMYVLYSTLDLTGNSTFRKNSGWIGGGMYAKESTLNISSDNIMKHSGDGKLCTPIFMKNSAMIHGGAVYAVDSVLHFHGHNVISGNSVHYSGGGIYSKNSKLTFSGSTSFSSNSGQLLGGGIYGLGTLLYFIGDSSFTANTAARGGGEYLVNSLNFLSQNASVTMDSNNATEYGGAVYVEDSDPISYCFPESINLERCLFQVDGLFQVSADAMQQLLPIFF